MVEAAEGTDVSACEAYTYDERVRYHVDYRTLREHAHELATDQPILTHMGTSMLSSLDQVERAAASDGLTLRV